jgi:RimJ/RimL family protein N-acetyltransferase
MSQEGVNILVIASGERVLLRDGLPSDADAYARWMTHGEWLAYDAPWETAGQSGKVQGSGQGFASMFVEERASPRNRAIIATTENRPIGWVTWYSEKRFPQACCVGMDICEDDYLNKGMGTEALRLWIRYLFLNSGVHRIGLNTYSFNKRMIRVAEKAGFIPEGADREIIQWQGHWLDRVRFGMLRQEWKGGM